MKIRIGNDFKTKWAITWLGEPEDFSDATDIALFFNIYDKKIELTKDVDYTITDNIIEIDVTPDICNILGVYNLELHYTKPNDDFIDGERRSAVDIDAFRIVGKSEKADATQDVSIISDAVAIFLDIAYKKLEEIEANEDVRIASEEERVSNEDIRISNEQDRQINTTTAISNAEQATLNANNSAVYANEQGAYAEEMSSHPPTIINDYWHIWNFTTNQYESTGQYARGDSAIDGALVVQEKGQSAVNTMSQKAITDELVQLAGGVEQLAYVKIKNEAVNGNFENGLIEPFRRVDGEGGASTLAINSSTPISGNYDIRFTITTPATAAARPYLIGLNRDGNIGDKIYLHFYAKILIGTPVIRGIRNGGGVSTIYGGDVINGRNTRIIDVEGTGAVGTIFFNSFDVWDMQMDNFMHINLTETFGAGNEPTEEEMNLLLDILGIDFFEGEITIPAQKIMQWQLKLRSKIPQISTQATLISHKGVPVNLVANQEKQELHFDTETYIIYQNNIFKIEAGTIVDLTFTGTFPWTRLIFFDFVSKTFRVASITNDSENKATESEAFIASVYLLSLEDDRWGMEMNGDYTINGFPFYQPFDIDEHFKVDWVFEPRVIKELSPYTEYPGLDTPDGDFFEDTDTANDVYALFDSLLDDNPDYISKTSIGDSAEGVPIYAYDFNPVRPTITSGSGSASPLPRILMGASIHGFEKLSTYTMYYFFHNIVNNWRENDTLEYLRHHINFLVVPVQNPDDFATNLYDGVSGINLNRDFGWKWSKQSNNGDEPFSRVESALLADFYSSKSESFCFIDCHVRGTAVVPVEGFLWASSVKDEIDVVSSAISNVTKVFRERVPELVTPENKSNGYMTVGAPGATVRGYVGGELGLKSFLWEGFKSSNTEPYKEKQSSNVVTANVMLMTEYVASIIKYYQYK